MNLDGMYFCGMCAYPLRDQPDEEVEVMNQAFVAAAASIRETLGVNAAQRPWRRIQRGYRSLDSEKRRKLARYETRARTQGYPGGHTERYDNDAQYRFRMDEEGIPRELPQVP